jgi:hypothetical protein
MKRALCEGRIGNMAVIIILATFSRSPKWLAGKGRPEPPAGHGPETLPARRIQRMGESRWPGAQSLARILGRAGERSTATNFQ